MSAPRLSVQNGHTSSKFLFEPLPAMPPRPRSPARAPPIRARISTKSPPSAQLKPRTCLCLLWLAIAGAAGSLLTQPRRTAPISASGLRIESTWEVGVGENLLNVLPLLVPVAVRHVGALRPRLILLLSEAKSEFLSTG